MPRHRLIIGLLLAIFLVPQTLVWPFERFRAFGRVTEAKALRGSQGITAGDFNGDGRCDLLSYTASKLGLLTRQAGDPNWELTVMQSKDEIDTLVACTANKDRCSDILLIARGQTLLRVLAGGPDNRISARWEFTLAEPFDNFTVGDINGDGVHDIILWSRHRTGMEVFLGKGNAMYARPETFFQDVAVGSVAVSDLDGDGVPDVVMTDWVTNELSVVHGFRKMKFSEPLVMKLESETSAIAISERSDTLRAELVLTAQSEPVQYLCSLTSEGELRVSSRWSIPDAIASTFTQDLDGDGLDETIVYSSAASVMTVRSVVRATQERSVSTYATGKHTRGCAPLVAKGMACEGMAVLDTASSTIRLYWTTGMSIDEQEDMCFASGLGATAILTLPGKPDRLRDVYVVNATSGDISYLENSRSGLHGAISIATPCGSGRVISLSRGPLLNDIFSAHTSPDSLLITSLNMGLSENTSVAIPADSGATILAAVLAGEPRKLTMYAISRSGPTANTVTTYEQLNSHRFLERTLSISGVLLDATLLDLTKDGVRDVVSFESLPSGKGSAMVLHSVIPPFSVGPAKTLLRLQESDARTAFIWPQDMNRDGLADLLLYTDGRESGLRLCLNRGDSTLADPVTLTTARVEIGNYTHLQTRDLNGDGYPDIILLNARTNVIELYLNDRRSTFDGPIRLFSGEGIGAFRIDDIDLDGSIEMLLADNSRGYLRIIRLKGIS